MTMSRGCTTSAVEWIVQSTQPALSSCDRMCVISLALGTLLKFPPTKHTCNTPVRACAHTCGVGRSGPALDLPTLGHMYGPRVKLRAQLLQQLPVQR